MHSLQPSGHKKASGTGAGGEEGERSPRKLSVRAEVMSPIVAFPLVSIRTQSSHRSGAVRGVSLLCLAYCVDGLASILRLH